MSDSPSTVSFPVAAVSRISKGEAAEMLYAGETYDCAIPQPWVDACRERGFDDVACHFVMLYPEGVGIAGSPYLAPITAEGVEIAARLATYAV